MGHNSREAAQPQGAGSWAFDRLESDLWPALSVGRGEAVQGAQTRTNLLLLSEEDLKQANKIEGDHSPDYCMHHHRQLEEIENRVLMERLGLGSWQ